MIKFLWKNVICRHECFEKLMIDKKFENRDFVAKLCEKYDDKRMMISFYHFQINEMIEKKHKFLTDALFKMIENDKKKWIKHLSTVLWTDRSTVRVNTEKTFFYLFCDNETVLFIEMKYFIWKNLFWNEIRNKNDFLIMRVRQLKRKKKFNWNDWYVTSHKKAEQKLIR